MSVLMETADLEDASYFLSSSARRKSLKQKRFHGMPQIKASLLLWTSSVSACAFNRICPPLRLAELLYRHSKLVYVDLQERLTFLPTKLNPSLNLSQTSP